MKRAVLVLFVLACLAIGWFGCRCTVGPGSPSWPSSWSRIPAHQQGVVAPVLAMAAAARRPGAAPVAAAAALAGIRGHRLGAADAVLRRRGQQGTVDLPFLNAALVRDALVLMLVYLSCADIMRPDKDLVRIAGGRRSVRRGAGGAPDGSPCPPCRPCGRGGAGPAPRRPWARRRLTRPPATRWPAVAEPARSSGLLAAVVNCQRKGAGMPVARKARRCRRLARSAHPAAWRTSPQVGRGGADRGVSPGRATRAAARSAGRARRNGGAGDAHGDAVPVRHVRRSGPTSRQPRQPVQWVATPRRDRRIPTNPGSAFSARRRRSRPHRWDPSGMTNGGQLRRLSITVLSVLTIAVGAVALLPGRAAPDSAAAPGSAGATGESVPAPAPTPANPTSGAPSSTRPPRRHDHPRLRR